MRNVLQGESPVLKQARLQTAFANPVPMYPRATGPSQFSRAPGQVARVAAASQSAFRRECVYKYSVHTNTCETIRLAKVKMSNWLLLCLLCITNIRITITRRVGLHNLSSASAFKFCVAALVTSIDAPPKHLQLPSSRLGTFEQLRLWRKHSLERIRILRHIIGKPNDCNEKWGSRRSQAV